MILLEKPIIISENIGQRTHGDYRNELTSRKKFSKAFGKPIEDFNSVKRAVERVGEASKNGYYYMLPNFFLYINENPDQVINNRRNDLNSTNFEQTDRYERLTISYAKSLMQKIAGKSVKGYVAKVQGFFSNNSRRYQLDLRGFRIPKARKKQKYSPTNEEMRHLYTFCDSTRDRLIILLMYHNGLAPVDVSDLIVGDLPTETWKYYEKSRSKTGEIWHGVITPEISHEYKVLLQLLGGPSNENNKSIEKRPLFMGRQGPLDRVAISQLVQVIIKKAGFNFKPTALRDALEDGLVDANVNHKVKESIIGHSSDIEHEYGGHNRLVINVVEAMKKAYPFLRLSGLKEESILEKNEAAELKARIEQRDLEIGRIIEEKNIVIAALQNNVTDLENRMQKVEYSKNAFEKLMKQVEEIELRIKEE